MKYFIKLNVTSILYAVMVFVPLELMINVYRISRLTNWEISTVNILTGVTIIFENRSVLSQCLQLEFLSDF
ncbi:hypothetical protein [Neobacillus sp. LXY-4]|uniref:hypothetical protein n=1 Tax=Neobacillus sp. LXY-4 TaxID=3379826 RepID=UPI003EE2ED78